MLHECYLLPYLCIWFSSVISRILIIVYAAYAARFVVIQAGVESSWWLNFPHQLIGILIPSLIPNVLKIFPQKTWWFSGIFGKASYSRNSIAGPRSQHNVELMISRPPAPAASRHKKIQVIQRFGKRLKWRRQINVEEAKLTESSLAPHRRVFPIGVAGGWGVDPAEPMGGGILLKKDVFWGLTLFFLWEFPTQKWLQFQNFNLRVSDFGIFICWGGSCWICWVNFECEKKKQLGVLERPTKKCVKVG